MSESQEGTNQLRQITEGVSVNIEQHEFVQRALVSIARTVEKGNGVRAPDLIQKLKNRLADAKRGSSTKYRN